VLSLTCDNTESFLVDFQDAIKGVIPLIIKSLKHEDHSVRSAGANAIGKVAKHGKSSYSLSLLKRLKFIL